MNDSKDKSGEDLFSDGSELFDNLFKEAPLEMEEDKKPKPAPRVKKEVKPAPELRRRGREQSRQTALPRREAPPVRQTIRAAKDPGPPTRPVDPTKTQPVKRSKLPPSTVPDKAERFNDLDFLGSRTVETEKGTLVLKSKPPKSKGRKGSKALKLVLLLLVLGIGAVVAVSSMGVVDLGRYIGWPSDKKVEPDLQQATRPEAEKKAPAAPATQAKPQPPASQQAAAPAEDKLARIETPVHTAVKRPKELPAKPETEVPASGPQAKAAQAQPPAPAVAQSQIPSMKETPQSSPAPQPSPPKPAPPQPAPVPQSPAKAVPLPSREQQPPRTEPAHISPYPFSVYLGAFMSLDRARTAVSIYEKDYGLSSYWVKVDLGEKGTWYRVFTGFFQRAEEAEAFIRQRHLKEGEVKQTKYSTLIGVFSSPTEAEAMVKKLLSLGYSSYFVPVPGGRFKLYSGAFYTLVGSEQQSAELASKGIKSRAVER